VVSTCLRAHKQRVLLLATLLLVESIQALDGETDLAVLLLLLTLRHNSTVVLDINDRLSIGLLDNVDYLLAVLTAV